MQSFTGRTIRAALNAMNEYEPLNWILAVLIERGHRQILHQPNH